MRNKLNLTLSYILLAVLFSACSKQNTSTVTPQPAAAGIANPASVNCEQKGGKLEMRARGDGGSYGVCVFKDNRQCEEWALYGGKCPADGVNVTGFTTDAAAFCVISGGEYTPTSNSGTANEQGTCTFKNATTCDASDFFNGKCSENK